ncbi:MAG TPA: O-antigen ligase family protein [Vicinamibacterales bacterium]|nr:O-antigen ligase family protein [Vicinamibacterales bacterium]
MLRSLFILAILVPGLFASIRSRYAALVMYLWFALFRPQDWLWIDINRFRLSLVIGVLLLVPGLASGIVPNVTHPLSVGMIMFLLSALVAQAHAVNPAFGWVWVDFLFRLLLASMMITTLSDNSKRLAGVIGVVGGSLGFHAAKAGLAYVVGGGTRFADGLSGAFVDNNGYALGTVMIMPMLIVTAQNVDLLYDGKYLTWIRRGFYGAVVLCMFAVVGTYSRGGFLSLSGAGLTYVLLQKRRFTALAAVAAIVTLFLAVVPIPDAYLARLQTIKTYEEVGEDSALSRPHFWKVGMRMAADNPFGIGIKQYEFAYDKYDFLHGRFGHKRAVHSSHVQVLAELGYMGEAVWILLFLYAFLVCIRVRGRSNASQLEPRGAYFLFTTANGLLVSMIGFLIGGTFLSLSLNDLTWLTFGMVAALDRLSVRMLAEPAAQTRGVAAPVVPLAFRVVPSYSAAVRGRTA